MENSKEEIFEKMPEKFLNKTQEVSKENTDNIVEISKKKLQRSREFPKKLPDDALKSSFFFTSFIGNIII